MNFFMKKNIFTLLFLVLLFCCKRAEFPISENNYLFENSQPINDSELNKIPSKFQGKFMSQDSSYLNIDAYCVYNEYYNKFKINKTKLDSLKSEFEITDKKFINKDLDKAFDYRILKDSIELSEKIIDTIFVISDNQKAKRIDGQLILSFKDSIFWNIKMISIQKNNLKIKQLSNFSDLKKLDSITKIKSKSIDSTSILIKPSRREFKKIINLKNLGTEMIYKKL